MRDTWHCCLVGSAASVNHGTIRRTGEVAFAAGAASCSMICTQGSEYGQNVSKSDVALGQDYKILGKECECIMSSAGIPLGGPVVTMQTPAIDGFWILSRSGQHAKQRTTPASSMNPSSDQVSGVSV